MSVTTALIAGNYSVNFEAGVRITDTAKPNTVRDVTAVGQGGMLPIRAELITGTGAGKANKKWAGVISLAAAGSTTLVLSDGSLTTAGTTVTFTKVRRVLVRVRTPVTGVKLRIGGAGTNPWAPWLSDQTATEDVTDVLLRVNDIDGFAVTAGMSGHDQLKFLAVAGAIVADVILIGE